MLEFDVDLIYPFVRSRVPGLPKFEGMTAIGLRKDGELVAGVIYEGFNGHNLWMHVGAALGTHVATQFAKGVLLREQIEAATTKEAVEAVVW